MRILPIAALCLCLVCGSVASASEEAEELSQEDKLFREESVASLARIWAHPRGAYDYSIEFARPGFFEEPVARKHLDNWIAIALDKGCVRKADCAEALPLVAYLFFDLDREERHTGAAVRPPKYTGYLTLAEADGELQYSWTHKDPERYDYLELRFAHPRWNIPWFLSYQPEPFRCEFSYGANCGSFFFWINEQPDEFPPKMVFFTSGLPPNDAWAPEFDAVSPAAAAGSAAREGSPAGLPRLKNPLPGMRPAPWYPPEAVSKP